MLPFPSLPSFRNCENPKEAIRGSSEAKQSSSMDSDTSLCCCLQFLIRQGNVSDKLLNTIISSLPVEAKNPLIQKELLIREIRSHVSKRSLTESTLDSLELLEKLYREDGVHVPASMKRAYCGVALDCTVRFLDGVSFACGKYLKAVERIWRGRIRELESGNSELVTDELKATMDDIEAAVCDVNAGERLLGKSTTRDALELAGIYVAEALMIMGPPFLELVAETRVEKQSRVAQYGQDSRVDGMLETFGVNAHEEVAVENEEENVTAESNSGDDNQKEVARTRSGRLDEFDVIVVEGEEDNKGHDKAMEDPILMEQPCSNTEPDEEEGEGDNIVGEDPMLSQPAHSNQDHNEQMHRDRNGGEAENVQTTVYNVGEGPTRIASETQAENSNGKFLPEVAPRSKYDTLTTPAVNKLVESLRASSSALGKMVVDPLPDALRKAEAVQLEIVQDEHGSTGQDNGRRPTLMERNATASTIEWSESLDASQPRPHLDEPRREVVSSLPKFSKRRGWTAQEEDALRNGVTKYGRGNWKMILDNNIAVLGLRSAVDLKDKWRNMTK